MAVVKGGSVAVAAKPVTLSAFVLGTAIVASYNVSWAPYSSDYTRYLPKDTPEKGIFWRSFFSAYCSLA